MLERAVIVCVLVAGLRCLANAQVVDPPPVIDEFDITKYLGRWYQVSATLPKYLGRWHPVSTMTSGTSAAGIRYLVSTRTNNVRLTTCYNANTFASLLVML